MKTEDSTLRPNAARPVLSSNRSWRLPTTSQRGMTLVELLVALVVSTLIAVAAVSALNVSRQGFATVDAASQLRDNARFAIDLLQKLGMQTGFRDVADAATSRAKNNAGVTTTSASNLVGADNATPSASDPQNTFIARTAGVGFGSDLLVLRYQTARTFPNSTVADGSMIDCAGATGLGVPADRDNRMASIIHVALSQNEPSLMCTTVNATGTISVAQPIIRGVENFQVLYGVDGVVPNTAPVTTASDAVADRYLRADQMTVPANPVATNDNWKRVRSIRIGMVLRGPANSAQGVATQTLYPLGQAKDSSSGAVGSAFSAAADVGSAFTPAADGRLRQVVTFTIHLRNAQDL